MLPLGIAAAVFEEDEADGGGDSVAVPEGDIDERLRRGLARVVRRVGEGFISSDDCAAQGRLGARIRRVARAGLAWRGVRVSVGGRDISERARRGAAVSVGGGRLRRAWPQALLGPGGGVPGIEGELEGGSVEPAGPGGEGGEVGGGRRGSRVLVGPGRSVSRDPGAALLGAQDVERARQAAQTRSGRSEVDAARDMAVRHP